MGADYSMRIWLKPDVMAQYGLMPTDVSAALAEQNIEAAPGQFGENGNPSFQYVMRYKGRLANEKEFEDIIIRATPEGEVLRLKDVADVELGRVSYGFHSTTNGHIGCSAIVFQAAVLQRHTGGQRHSEGSGPFPEKEAPKGIKLTTSMNVNDFLYASIEEVIKTLIEAFVLVFLVVFIFLQDFRSTIIPMIAIPVALIGTFFLLNIFGFSINLLTLSALVLAIAIVVDDAIVVVEAVHAKLDQGYQSARRASIDAVNEISGAIVSITLVMMLVFIPVSFMGGTSGVFYRQFGLTMAMAIGLSAINALTLSPALCAIFLKPHNTDATLKERLGDAYSAAGEVMKRHTKTSLRLRFPPLITTLLIIAAVVFLVLGWYSFENVALSVMAVVVAILAVIGMFSRRFLDSFNRGFDKLLGGYKKWTDFFVSHKLISFGFVAASIGVLVWLMSSTATSHLCLKKTQAQSWAWSICLRLRHRKKTKRIMDQGGQHRRHYPGNRVPHRHHRLFVRRRTGQHIRFIHHQTPPLERTQRRQSDCGCGFGHALSEVFGNQRRPHNVLQTAYGKRIFGYQRF